MRKSLFLLFKTDYSKDFIVIRRDAMAQGMFEELGAPRGRSVDGLLQCSLARYLVFIASNLTPAAYKQLISSSVNPVSE